MIFSIIIPAYNAEKFICNCIQNACEQDLEKDLFEVIVVDDKSPDKLSEKVLALQCKYTNLIYLQHNINKKQGGARNTGIKAAKGDWILFLDADDCFLYRNTLSLLFLYLSQNSCCDVLQSSSYQDIAANDYCKMDMYNHPLKEITIYKAEEYLSLKNFSYSVIFSCYKRSLLLNNHLFFRENVVFEDSDWSIMSIYNAQYIGLISFPYYGYRSNPDSITRKPRKSTFIDNIQGIISIYNFLYSGISISENCLHICLDRVKKSIFSYIMISRNYNILDSLYCISILNRSKLMNVSLYTLNIREYLFLLVLKYCPILIIVPTRILTLVKRFIIKWIQKSK